MPENFEGRDKTEVSRPVETIEFRGDPKVGTVYFLEQVHKRPEFGPEQKRAVGKYQFGILVELAKMKDEGVKDIFVESLYEDFEPNHPARNESGEMKSAVEMVFPGGIPDEPNDLQLEMLYDLGASMILAYMDGQVSLHKTLTKETSDRIDNDARRKIKDQKFFQEIIMQKREEVALDQIEGFLKDNPGAKVALVYGAMHDFSKHLKSSSQKSLPMLLSLKFPDLSAKFRVASQAEAGKEEQKTKVDLEKEKLHDWEFQHIKTEADQLAALKKLDLDAVRWNEINPNISLRDFLHKNAASDKVRKAIEYALIAKGY